MVIKFVYAFNHGCAPIDINGNRRITSHHHPNLPSFISKLKKLKHCAPRAPAETRKGMI